MQRLNQFCGQVNLWHRAKRMVSRKKRVFSCTWGKTASSLRKRYAVKGQETRLWHKLYSGETRHPPPHPCKKTQTQPQNKTPVHTLQYGLSCICQKGDICWWIYLGFFRVDFLKEGGRCSFLCACLSEIQTVQPVAARGDNNRKLEACSFDGGAERQQGWA